MLHCKKIKFSYPKFTLEADFSIEKGEIVALSGKSGSGKSTLFSLISGFLAPSEGQIIIDNNDIINEKPGDRPLTLLFQDHNLFEHLTVWQNIGLGLNTSLKLSFEQQQKIKRLLVKFDLENKYNAMPHQLSGGQRKRVALARALVRNKPLLLLDEGFTGVDDETKDDLIHFIKELHSENNLTICFITHNLDEITKLSTRTINIIDGKIL